jgi:hypothetical protein
MLYGDIEWSSIASPRLMIVSRTTEGATVHPQGPGR